MSSSHSFTRRCEGGSGTGDCLPVSPVPLPRVLGRGLPPRSRDTPLCRDVFRAGSGSGRARTTTGRFPGLPCHFPASVVCPRSAQEAPGRARPLNSVQLVPCCHRWSFLVGKQAAPGGAAALWSGRLMGITSWAPLSIVVHSHSSRFTVSSPPLRAVSHRPPAPATTPQP